MVLSRKRFFLWAAALALWAGCGPDRRPAGLDGQAAPGFALAELSGRTVRLEEFRGRALLLDFWATYCGPCRDALPAFQRLSEEWGPKGLSVVGVSLDGPGAEVAAYARELGVRYPILLDPETSLRQPYGLRALPTTFLLDAQGVVRRQWVGYEPGDLAQIRSEIEKALGENRS